MAGVLAEFAVFLVLAVVVVTMLDSERDHEDIGAFLALGMWFAYLVHADTVTSAAYLRDERVGLPATPMLVLGLAVVAAGLVLFAWASRALIAGGGFRGVTSSRLVTSGAYRLIRHPQDLGWATMLLGVSIAGRSPVSLALVAVFWVFVSRVWRADERQLAKRFGEPYLEYRARTPAIVPAGWPLSSGRWLTSDRT